MQLKAMVPDQRAGPAVLWQVKRQDDRGSPSSHWEYHPPALLAHGLGRPVDRVEAFRLPGILHAHLGMRRTELAGRIDGGNKGVCDHLDGLTVQGKAPFGGLLQVVLSRPHAAGSACRFVQVAAPIPDLRPFHLCGLETPKQG